MIDDDEVAEAGQNVGIRDSAGVHGPDGGAGRSRDFNTVSDGGITRTAGCLAEPHGKAPLRRPFKGAPERRERNDDGIDGSSGRGAGDLLLHALISHLQLTGELCVQVAARVDLSDQRPARRHRAIRRDARLLRFRRPRFERAQLGLERRALGPQLLHRAAMFFEPGLVDAHEGSDGARRPAQVADGSAAEQQGRIPRASALVDVHELRFHVGQLRESPLLECVEPGSGVANGRFAAGHRVLRLTQALHLYLAFDFEGAELAEQRTGLAGQRVGLGLERPDPFVDPLRLRVASRAIGDLRGGNGADREHDDTARHGALDHPEGCEDYSVRAVAFDVGQRRIGVAISDATLTLARPIRILQAASLESDGVRLAASEIDRLAAEDDGVALIVIGLPRRLDGSPTDMTERIRAFAAKLARTTPLPIVFQDERLTSREAESRLAVTDKNWRSRKKRLDAAAAAIVLQDYLDTRPGRPVPAAVDPEL